MTNLSATATGPVRTTRHSENNEWYTPRWLVDALSERIAFDVDLCASASNAVATRYGFESAQAGDTAWLNPPYGAALVPCLTAAVERVEAEPGLAAVVALLPVRTSTSWWHGASMRRARQLVFLRGRLRFGGSGSNAPFDSVLAVFGCAPSIRRVVALRGRERVEWGTA